MKFKINTIVSAVLLCILLVGTSINAEAASINLQFANVSCDGTTYCATVQINASAISQIGNSTIWIDYNKDAITNPISTPLNFDPADGYLTDTPQFSYLEQASGGEINYNILLASSNTGVTAPSIDVPGGTDWEDVAEFCWTVVDATLSPDLQFNATYTGFNDETNDSSVHLIGSSAGETEACPMMTGGVSVDVKVFLEGAMDGAGTAMTTTLATGFTGNVIPSEQPYNAAPWNYAGTESFSTVPADATDWVLVQLATGQATATVVESKAGIALSDGSVVDAVNGGPLTFSSASASTPYFVIVRHRNHLPIATPAAVTGGSITFDFTTTVGTPPGTFTPMVDVGGGIYAMYAGNVNGDGFVNAGDYAIWKLENSMFFTYLGGDINLDQFVNAADFVIWKANNSKFSNPAIWP